MDEITVNGVPIPYVTDESGRKMYQLKSIMEAAGFQRSSCVTRIVKEIGVGEKARAEVRTPGTTPGTIPSCVVTLKGVEDFVQRRPISMTRRHWNGIASVAVEMARAERSPRPVEQMIELAEDQDVSPEDEIRMQIANIFRRIENLEKVVSRWK